MRGASYLSKPSFNRHQYPLRRSIINPSRLILISLSTIRPVSIFSVPLHVRALRTSAHLHNPPVPTSHLRTTTSTSASTSNMATATSKYTIRAGEEKDIPQLLLMIKELAAYQGAEKKAVATEDMLRKTLTFPSSAPGQGFARTLLIYPIVPDAIEGGKILPSHRKAMPPGRAVPPSDASDADSPSLTPKPAGMAVYFTTYGTWTAKPGVYCEDLYVREEYRGMGFGKALLSALAREVKRLDGFALSWSVMHSNEKSIAFYESPAIGAKHVADWKQYRVDGERLDKLGEAQ